MGHGAAAELSVSLALASGGSLARLARGLAGSLGSLGSRARAGSLGSCGLRGARQCGPGSGRWWTAADTGSLRRGGLPRARARRPSRSHTPTLSPTLRGDHGRTRGASARALGPSRCFPCPPPSTTSRSPNRCRRRPACRATDTIARPHAFGVSACDSAAGRPSWCTRRADTRPRVGAPLVGRQTRSLVHMRFGGGTSLVVRAACRHAVACVWRQAGRRPCRLRGARGRRAREQREDPGLARRRPLVRAMWRDRVGESAVVIARDGAASTCPGRTRVAGPHRPSAPSPAQVSVPRVAHSRPRRSHEPASQRASEPAIRYARRPRSRP